MSRIPIAVDVMSGDLGPQVVLESSLSFMERNASVYLFLVGQNELLCRLIEKMPAFSRLKRRYQIVHAPEVVSMSEKPSIALRRKQDASMSVALTLVRDGQASACVSAGNTGALMAFSRFHLDTLPGIDRPAIIKRIPLTSQNLYLLDLGANVDCKAEQLLQFAVLGSLLVEIENGGERPRVGLLNVGKEDIKGNEQVRLASQLLKDSSLINYSGYVEGNELFTGAADVVVCDGFVGNVALKVSEGVLSLAMQVIRDRMVSTWYGRIVGWLAWPLVRSLKNQLEPAYFNGAELIGLKGVVIKSHGNADAVGFGKALEEAVIGVRKNVPEVLGQKLKLWEAEVLV